ncbi:MAG: LysR substrate-binding domain-containing protein [Christensenellales bacterium]|jgi:DNA-binding transcriptional LysR family regulator
MLDVKIETLLIVADTLNFTRAAKELSLTQPAVSQHIKALETQLKVTLFSRREKELRPTEEGEIVIEYARKMKALNLNMVQALQDRQRRVRRLAVGIMPKAENNGISRIFAMYGSRNLSLHITITTDQIKDLYAKLKNYEIHLAVIEGDTLESGYNSILLDTDYLVLAVANSNPLSRKSIATLSDLRKEKLILRLPASETRKLFEKGLSSIGQSIDTFNVILEVDNNNIIKELVEANFGVSIISKNACATEVRQKRFTVLPIENLSIIREVHIVYNQEFEHPDILNDIVGIYNESMSRLKE